MAKSDIKNHIIAVASKLFYTNGYNATGINEIITKSEIAKATLYHHFKSKEAICAAYLELRHQDFMSSLRTYVSERPQGRLQLLAIFDYLREIYRERNFYGCWAIKTFCELPPDNEHLSGVVQKQKKELLFFLGGVVDDNLKNLSLAETEKISGGLYMLYESAITESHLHQDDWPIHLARSIAPSLYAGATIK